MKLKTIKFRVLSQICGLDNGSGRAIRYVLLLSNLAISRGNDLSMAWRETISYILSAFHPSPIISMIQLQVIETWQQTFLSPRKTFSLIFLYEGNARPNPANSCRLSSLMNPSVYYNRAYLLAYTHTWAYLHIYADMHKRSKYVYIRSRKQKLHGLSPRANCTDRATAACRRSECQILRIEGATWSAWQIPTAVVSVF
jgi:hypothetical protein